jgi:hypothetical protein
MKVNSKEELIETIECLKIELIQLAAEGGTVGTYANGLIAKLEMYCNPDYHTSEESVALMELKLRAILRQSINHVNKEMLPTEQSRRTRRLFYAIKAGSMVANNNNNNNN